MNESNNMLVDFCLPIKNEALILEDSLNRLISYCEQAGFDFSWRVIGVVNGSDDNSVKILHDFKVRFPGKVGVFEVVEPGRGRALKKYWSYTEADIVSYMDCDLAVSLENLPALILPLVSESADLTIGSRLSVGAQIKRSVFREFISQGYNLLSRLLLNHDFPDLQCGFKGMRRDKFLALNPFLVDDYWFFDTELIILSQRFDYEILQVPVDWQENRFGKRPSTVKIFRDSWKFIKDMLAFRRRLRKIGYKASSCQKMS